jgi:selenide,water dikinase
MAEPIRLTRFATGGGCARKVGAADLREVLGRLGAVTHPWADPQVGPFEDAAVVRPPAGPALAFTVDFITPMVDDPVVFGRIAAVNAMSDVWAMGGTPRVALGVCGFPSAALPLDVLEAIFRGGREAAAEAGCAVVGGHTIQDAELKYGLCVIGDLPASGVLDHTRARPGDRLVLTKPIGLGAIAHAIKVETAEADDVAAAVRVMTTTNAAAAEAALAAGVRAATDVTGFGLLGHLHHLCLGAGLAARISASAVPVLEGARRFAAAGEVPGGTRKNLAYVQTVTTWDPGIPEDERLLLADAQTSGGLLLAVPADRTAELVGALGARGTLAAAVIGRLDADAVGAIAVER